MTVDVLGRDRLLVLAPPVVAIVGVMAEPGSGRPTVDHALAAALYRYGRASALPLRMVTMTAPSRRRRRGCGARDGGWRANPAGRIVCYPASRSRAHY